MKTKRWDTILDRLPANQSSAVEVGVWKCQLSEALLRKNSLLKLYLVDPWQLDCMPDGAKKKHLSQDYLDALYEEARLLAKEYPGRCEVIRKTSVEAAAYFEPFNLDLVFLDGDHTYTGVMHDVYAWIPKVRVGGWIGGHDYGAKFPGVAKAVNQMLGDKVETDTNATWWYQIQ